MRSLTLAALTVAALTAGVARADVVDDLSLTYASGATFNGTLVLSDDFSSVLSLNGTLFGYDSGSQSQGVGLTDPISSLPSIPLFNLGSIYGLGSNVFFSMVSDTGGFNWLDFGYSYTSSGITLNPGGQEDLTYSQSVVGYNNADYYDPLVSASATSVPEPGTLTLLGLGLLGLAATRRRWTLKVARLTNR